MDPETFAVPAEDAAALVGNRRRYIDALRDWVDKGAHSAFALSPDEVLRRMRRPDEGDAPGGSARAHGAPALRAR